MGMVWAATNADAVQMPPHGFLYTSRMLVYALIRGG
jgi:hypothetical protein